MKKKHFLKRLFAESDFLVQSSKAGEKVNNHPDGFRVNAPKR